MNAKYLFIIAGMLLTQLTVAWGQTEVEKVLDRTECVKMDTVKSESKEVSVSAGEQLLPVSECETRALMIKNGVAQKKVKRSLIVGDPFLKKRVNILEVKCDSLDSKLDGISTRLKEKVVTSKVQTDSVVKPYILQICVLTNPIKKSELAGRKLEMDRINGYYRYFLSYAKLSDAQEDLSVVREFFPDAFIRK